MKRTHRLMMTVCFFFGVLTALSSCAGNPDTSGTPADVKKLSCLVVLPTGISADTEKRMDSVEAKNLKDGAVFIDGVLTEEMKSFSGARLLNAAQFEGIGLGVSGNRLDMIKSIGKELKCDAILMTTIGRFHQREGSEFAADSPASAAFSLELVRVEDGKVLWRSSFDETQESLLSNLLSFGKAQSRGFKWVTVEELVRQGVHERLAACPYLQ